MELINNTTKTLKDDLSVEIKQGSKVSIAAACFSIYAFQELKAQLSQIDELRFIFTSPTFVTEKAKKEKREFYNGEMTTDGFGINYNECGLRLPCKVNAYDTLTATALFHDFPAKIKKRCKGMIVLNTAIGNVKKKITMIEYNKDREEFEYQDYLCYCRSLEEIN